MLVNRSYGRLDEHRIRRLVTKSPSVPLYERGTEGDLKEKEGIDGMEEMEGIEEMKKMDVLEG